MQQQPPRKRKLVAAGVDCSGNTTCLCLIWNTECTDLEFHVWISEDLVKALRMWPSLSKPVLIDTDDEQGRRFVVRVYPAVSHNAPYVAEAIRILVTNAASRHRDVNDQAPTLTVEAPLDMGVGRTSHNYAQTQFTVHVFRHLETHHAFKVHGADRTVVEVNKIPPMLGRQYASTVFSLQGNNDEAKEDEVAERVDDDSGAGDNAQVDDNDDEDDSDDDDLDEEAADDDDFDERVDVEREAGEGAANADNVADDPPSADMRRNIAIHAAVYKYMGWPIFIRKRTSFARSGEHSHFANDMADAFVAAIAGAQLKPKGAAEPEQYNDDGVGEGRWELLDGGRDDTVKLAHPDAESLFNPRRDESAKVHWQNAAKHTTWPKTTLPQLYDRPDSFLVYLVRLAALNGAPRRGVVPNNEVIYTELTEQLMNGDSLRQAIAKVLMSMCPSVLATRADNEAGEVLRQVKALTLAMDQIHTWKHSAQPYDKQFALYRFPLVHCVDCAPRGLSCEDYLHADLRRRVAQREMDNPLNGSRHKETVLSINAMFKRAHHIKTERQRPGNPKRQDGYTLGGVQRELFHHYYQKYVLEDIRAGHLNAAHRKISCIKQYATYLALMSAQMSKPLLVFDGFLGMLEAETPRQLSSQVKARSLRLAAHLVAPRYAVMYRNAVREKIRNAVKEDLIEQIAVHGDKKANIHIGNGSKYQNTLELLETWVALAFQFLDVPLRSGRLTRMKYYPNADSAMEACSRDRRLTRDQSRKFCALFCDGRDKDSGLLIYRRLWLVPQATKAGAAAKFSPVVVTVTPDICPYLHALLEYNKENHPGNNVVFRQRNKVTLARRMVDWIQSKGLRYFELYDGLSCSYDHLSKRTVLFGAGHEDILTHLYDPAQQMIEQEERHKQRRAREICQAAGYMYLATLIAHNKPPNQVRHVCTVLQLTPDRGMLDQGVFWSDFERAQTAGAWLLSSIYRQPLTPAPVIEKSNEIKHEIKHDSQRYPFDEETQCPC